MHLKIETGQKGREEESESEHVINFLLRGKANSFSVYRERALWQIRRLRICNTFCSRLSTK